MAAFYFSVQNGTSFDLYSHDLAAGTASKVDSGINQYVIYGPDNKVYYLDGKTSGYLSRIDRDTGVIEKSNYWVYMTALLTFDMQGNLYYRNNSELYYVKGVYLASDFSTISTSSFWSIHDSYDKNILGNIYIRANGNVIAITHEADYERLKIKEYSAPNSSNKCSLLKTMFIDNVPLPAYDVSAVDGYLYYAGGTEFIGETVYKYDFSTETSTSVFNVFRGVEYLRFGENNRLWFTYYGSRVKSTLSKCLGYYDESLCLDITAPEFVEGIFNFFPDKYGRCYFEAYRSSLADPELTWIYNNGSVQNLNIPAIAYAKVWTGGIPIALLMPQANYNSGTYNAPLSVTMTCPDPDALIYYTLDGNTPTTSSNQYSGPVNINSSKTLKIRVHKNGQYSGTAIYNYNIDLEPPAEPVITANTTTPTNQDVTVTINYPVDAAVKRYLINGVAYQNYSGPFLISQNATIEAKCQDAAGNWSSEASLTISNIDKTPPDDPIINASTTLPVRSVDITITYPIDAVIKEYKLQNGTYQNYTGTFTLTNNTIVYARCQDAVGNPSNEVSFVISNIDTMPPNDPVIDASTTSLATNIDITISYSADAVTKEYKLKGGSYQNYTGTFILTSNTAVYAKCQDVAGNWSNEVSYVVSNIASKCEPVSIQPTTWIADAGGNVKLTSTTLGCMISYTIDGPDPSSSVGMVISNDTEIQVDGWNENLITIKAMAFKSGHIDSDITSLILDEKTGCLNTDIDLNFVSGNWVQFDETYAGNWSHDSVTASLTNAANQNGISGFYNQDHLNLADYRFIIHYKTTSTDDDGIGVLFRFQDKDNWYAVLSDDGGLGFANNISIIKKKGGVKSNVGTALVPSAAWIRYEENRLEVIVTQGHIIVNLNGQLVYEFDDSAPILSGALGPATQSQPNTTFTDLSVITSTPPETPILIPVSSINSITDSQVITLQWSEITDPGHSLNREASYKLMIGTGPEIQDVLPITDLGQVNEYNITLGYGTYYWSALAYSKCSDMASAWAKPSSFTIRPPVPWASHSSGIYNEKLTVYLYCAAAVDIYYTLDGTIPTASGNKYNGPLDIDKYSHLKCVAIANNIRSEIANYDYTIIYPYTKRGMNYLRDLIDQYRASHGMIGYNWKTEIIPFETSIMLWHITELRQAIEEIYSFNHQTVNWSYKIADPWTELISDPVWFELIEKTNTAMNS